jgi:hypothetical protein
MRHLPLALQRMLPPPDVLKRLGRAHRLLKSAYFHSPSRQRISWSGAACGRGPGTPIQPFRRPARSCDRPYPPERLRLFVHEHAGRGHPAQVARFRHTQAVPEDQLAVQSIPVTVPVGLERRAISRPRRPLVFANPVSPVLLGPSRRLAAFRSKAAV